jgi:hypothetical protein
MIRAAVSLMVVGIILIGWTALWIWLYRQAAGVAPEWMLERRGRGSSLLEDVTFMSYLVTGQLLGFLCVVAFFKVLRIPADALQLETETTDFPFNRRKPSNRALRQPGQKGFVDAKLQAFDAFAKGPETPSGRNGPD